MRDMLLLAVVGAVAGLVRLLLELAERILGG